MTPSTRIRSLAASLVVALVAGSVAGAADDYPRLRDLDGRAVDAFADGDRSAYVFVFVRTDCPISNRYAPELARLNERFTARGVTFALVYPGEQTDPEAIRDHVREYHYPFVALRDPDFSFVDFVDATVTPEVAVFDSRRTLRYVGRIDDRYLSAGQMRPGATRHDLVDALEGVLAGRQVESTRTAAVGCLIADIR
jgi:Redoxin